MARLKTLPSRLGKQPVRQLATTSTRERRMTGRGLQDRRWKVWQKDPHCAGCGRLVEFPGGFELDHITPLFQGGADSEENCQILCVRYGLDGKSGCHVAKTAEDLKI